MAKLSWVGRGGDALSATFVREGARTSQRALRHMRRVSKLVMQQSIRNTPVDWKGHSSKEPPGHEFERSHRLEERYGGAGRIEATIAVGGMIGGIDVDLYAEWIHEGDYQLGRASLAKAVSDSRNKVGPQFLERALQEHEDEFEGLLDDLIQGLMG